VDTSDNSKCLDEACHAVDAVFIVVPSPVPCGSRLGYAQRVIDAAVRAGVSYLLLLSSAGNDARDFPALYEFHDIEEYLKSACASAHMSEGVEGSRQSPAWTILRGDFYMENLLIYAQDVKLTGTLHLPWGETGKVVPLAARVSKRAERYF
jgi:hypothetical protein